MLVVVVMYLPSKVHSLKRKKDRILNINPRQNEIRVYEIIIPFGYSFGADRELWK